MCIENKGKGRAGSTAILEICMIPWALEQHRYCITIQYVRTAYIVTYIQVLSLSLSVLKHSMYDVEVHSL